MAKTEKKLGSVKDIKSTKKLPFKERIWDYKPYFIVGIIIIAAILLYFMIFQYSSRNPQVFQGSPSPKASVTPSPTPTVGTGRLNITTIPPTAFVQCWNRKGYSPITLDEIPEGKTIVILTKDGYKKMQKEVEIKKNETTKLVVTMEK